MTIEEAQGARDNELALQLTDEGRDYRDLVSMAREQAEAGVVLARVLRELTLKQTLPQDWVVMGQGEKAQCYLMERGCQRITKAWGIVLEKLDPRNDIVREDITAADGFRHVKFIVSGAGRSLRTGEERSDIGSRSTMGEFWREEWESEETSDWRREAIIDDVRKSAVANLYGRLIRALTGTNGLPPEELVRAGLDTSKCRGVRFQTGTRGAKGSAGSDVSDNQMKFLLDLAGQKVADCPAREALEKQLKDVRGFSRSKASSLIEWLQKQEMVELAVFKRAAGLVVDEAPEGGDDDA